MKYIIIKFHHIWDKEVLEAFRKKNESHTKDQGENGRRFLNSNTGNQKTLEQGHQTSEGEWFLTEFFTYPNYLIKVRVE